MYRIDKSVRWRGTTVVGAQTFAAIPAVVAATPHAVNLLECTLSDVAGPEISGCRIEAPTPRVAEAPREELGAVVRRHRVIGGAHRTASERIVRRNFIWRSRGIDIEPQE